MLLVTPMSFDGSTGCNAWQAAATSMLQQTMEGFDQCMVQSTSCSLESVHCLGHKCFLELLLSAPV